jgi:deoxycytidine triphosphate deaminase
MQLDPRVVLKRGIIKVADEDAQLQQVGVDLTLSEDVTILPGRCVNTSVAELFDMQDTFGLITIRSSYSRRGVFLSSGVYDPGFKGVGGVTLYNLSTETITLLKGTRIAQMIVFFAKPAKEYDGHYNHNHNIKSKLER